MTRRPPEYRSSHRVENAQSAKTATKHPGATTLWGPRRPGARLRETCGDPYSLRGSCQRDHFVVVDRRNLEPDDVALLRVGDGTSRTQGASCRDLLSARH